MGRLFWKFFACILLAQLAATVGIGGAFWLKDRAFQRQKALELDTSPPAQQALDAAAATLEFGGSKALRGLLGTMRRHQVYAVADDGSELLGRAVSAAMLGEARASAGQSGQRPAVRTLRGADGLRFLLFLPSSAHLFGGGPFGAFMQPPPAPPDAGAGMPPPPPPDGAGGAPPQGHGGPADPRFHPFIPIIAATLASLLFAALLAWYFSRPIRALRQAFDAAAAGDLAPRFAGAGRRGDELSDLGQDFDRMTLRLRSLIDGQTRLLHDVSHELRSPLARLQAAIGLAHQQPDKLQASLERIERESVRMDRLVGELLTLSRLEAGAFNGMHEEISAADLIDEIVGDARFEAAAQQRHISVEGATDALLTGRADLLGSALENVVRNALKHSPEGGTVQVVLGLADGARQLRIQVLDRGPGVAPPDLGAIFEPFYRSPGAQGATDGHGLGLAIARQVVQAHRGSIAASNRSGGGLCVDIILPLAGSDGAARHG